MTVGPRFRSQRAINVFVAISVLLVAGPLGISCSDDDPVKPPETNTSPFKPLNHRDNVLLNLELAYIEQNTSEIDKLLDDDFVFYFSESDYTGGDAPRFWDRSAELASTTQMFDSSKAGSYQIVDIDMSVYFTEGDAAWAPVPPPDTLAFPGETWYQKTATYDISVEVEAQPSNITYEAKDIAVEVTVRQAEVGGKTVWRVVECRDDIDTGSAFAPASGETGTAEEVTWGRIKLWCYDGPKYQDLTERDHVLENLELAYNQWNLFAYDKILDEDFVFFFSFEDFSRGETPEQWDRAAEMAAAANMFDRGYTGRYKPISIKLGLDYTKGEASWVATVPDQDLYPGETWYFKPVIYNLTLVAEAWPENITFIGVNIKALFTVRQTELEGEQVWRIVEWRDDIDIRSRILSKNSKIQETKWGKIKSFYGG